MGARQSPALAHLADGIERADSWATDAHKWLNVPYDCGIAIVRHAGAHRAAMTSAAAYLIQTAGAERDAVRLGARVLAPRARRAGLRGAALARPRRRRRIWSTAAARWRGGWPSGSRAEPGVRILNDVVLNQVLVRFGDDDALTRAVVAGVQDDGTCWLGGTTWHGMAAMRISVSNWSTTEDDAARSVEAILGIFRRVSGR